MSEARLEDGGHGLIRTSAGWFVLNARDARWRHTEGRSTGTGFSGPELPFEQLGVGLAMLLPGEPMAQYHWETDQEDFLVLAGEALLVVEGEERPLRAWDFVHCPPGTRHAIVGAGEGPCWIFGVGAREGGPDWGSYEYDPVAARHGACPPEDTTDPEVAYADWPDSEPARFRDGWLPW
jgi:uncharacterized cupin superfamily protein